MERAQRDLPNMLPNIICLNLFGSANLALQTGCFNQREP
jgi:hypothetical protein